jgi:site-specific DNA recombinase
MARIRKSRDSAGRVERERVVWHIAIYIRLSKDDGNDESLSVTNQKKITMDYLEHFFEQEYIVVDFYIDDGLTGTDYERPGFQRMMQDVEAGKVNCILCKNLSRAFRNYSDQGYFLESYFPLHDTRFITIGDPKVDSFLRPETIQNLEVPITGLMNDRFACKTSNDVRDTFNTKRRNGEFIGAFAPYGYAKDPKDKNSLIIDDEAAHVVRDIFHWFAQEGSSKNGIARRLNEMGIPNPTAYKRKNGLAYSNPYVDVNDGLWNANTIARILKNQMYIGNMVQGRQKVISYKVHNKVLVPEDEWFIKENTHEPIIDRNTFDKVQGLQQRDTRTALEHKELHLFSGFLRCADCKKALTRKQSKDIVYYSCRTYNEKSKTKCTKHSIREDVLQQAVLIAIQKQIELVDTLTGIIETINSAPIVHTQSTRLNHMLKLRTGELDKLGGVIDSLYLDWKNGDITRDEYRRMKVKFEEQAEQFRQVIHNLNEEIQTMSQGVKSDEPYLESFLKYRNISRLERGILVELVDTIYVCEGGGIKIEFNFADQHRRVIDFIENNRRELTVLENKAV